MNKENSLQTNGLHSMGSSLAENEESRSYAVSRHSIDKDGVAGACRVCQCSEPDARGNAALAFLGIIPPRNATDNGSLEVKPIGEVDMAGFGKESYTANGSKRSGFVEFISHEGEVFVCNTDIEMGCDHNDDTLVELGCSCKNDLALVHYACALKWFVNHGSTVCEICACVAKNIRTVDVKKVVNSLKDYEALRESTANGEPTPAQLQGNPGVDPDAVAAIRRQRLSEISLWFNPCNNASSTASQVVSEQPSISNTAAEENVPGENRATKWAVEGTGILLATGLLTVTLAWLIAPRVGKMGGITTELVRNVFKTRSLKASNCHAKCNMLERRRWSTVRSYLCGDEYNSVAADLDSDSITSCNVAVVEQEFSSDAAVQDSGSILRSTPASRICEFNSEFSEEDHGDSAFSEEDHGDSASSKSSEATVAQPIPGETVANDYTMNVRTEEEVGMEKPNSTLKLFQQEDAAIIIQTAFRCYMARRERSEMKLDGGSKQEVQFANASPESFSTSLKVQIGDSSTETSSIDVGRENVSQPIQKRIRRAQVDWDDSTVSSAIIRKRIQNRIEAATRRERALAYAFAQQLRVCTNKKRTKCNGLDSNSSLSWLERWMATRQSEKIFMEIHRRKQRLELSSCKLQEPMFLDGVEEKESCGSNDVSVQIDGFSVGKNGSFRPPKANRNDKALTLRNNNISKAKNNAKNSLHKGEQEKLTCRAGKDNKDEVKQQESKKDMKFQDSLSAIA